MYATARVTSQGQITVPKQVRERLGLNKGDSVAFKIDDSSDESPAVIERVPNFLELAGSVKVPPEKKGMSWKEIRREAWEARAKKIVGR